MIKLTSHYKIGSGGQDAGVQFVGSCAELVMLLNKLKFARMLDEQVKTLISDMELDSSIQNLTPWEARAVFTRK